MDEGAPMKDAAILITGASGFTGEHACRTFAALGMRVIALVRRPMNIESNLAIEQVTGDVLDEQGLRQTIKRISPNYVLHLAGMNAVKQAWRSPVQAIHINMMGTLHILEALREHEEVRVLVVTSKLKSPPTTPRTRLHPYALSKWFQEQTALAWSRLYDMNIMLAEPSNLIGPGPSTGICALLGDYVAQVEQGHQLPPFRFSSRQDFRDYLDVRDAVDAYALILQHGQKSNTYQIESGQLRSLADVSEQFRMLSAVVVPYHWEEKQLEAKQVEEASRIDVTEPMKANPMPAEWNWKPKYTFAESVSHILHYYRQLRR